MHMLWHFRHDMEAAPAPSRDHPLQSRGVSPLSQTRCVCLGAVASGSGVQTCQHQTNKSVRCVIWLIFQCQEVAEIVTFMQAYPEFTQNTCQKLENVKNTFLLPVPQFHAMFSELRRMFGPSKVRNFASVIIIKAIPMGIHSVWILSCVNTPSFRTVFNRTGNVCAKTFKAVFRWKPKPSVELAGWKGTGQRLVSWDQLSRSTESRKTDNLTRAVRCLQSRDLSYCRCSRNEIMVLEFFIRPNAGFYIFPFFLQIALNPLMTLWDVDVLVSDKLCSKNVRLPLILSGDAPSLCLDASLTPKTR